ncbi:MAG: DegQ family serine endoprotease [Alphaproteobacteria bacterium]
MQEFTEGRRARPRARRNKIWASIIGGMVASLLLAGTAPARTAPENFADLAEKLLPSVVNISTSQTVKGAQRGPDMPQFPPGSPFEEFFKDFFERRGQQDNQPRRATSLGSGFIIDPTGYVVTNNHVIEGADEINVILNDDKSLPAKVIGKDSKTDLALLKVESPKPLPATRWGDSNVLRVGEWVIAIGNPFGLGGSVTAGIVSARGRDIHAGPYDDFIQTDASINKGNSGGPMFNMKGEVIGVNTAIYSPSGGSIGIGFAIPSSQVRPVIQQLREFGRTRRGWLGVHIQTVNDEIAENLGLGATRGALVASVSDGSPAKKAGVQAGDVIVSFDGKDIRRMRQLPQVVAETPIGKKVPVVIWRKGKESTVMVELGELTETEQVASAPAKKEPAEERGGVSELGMTMQTLTAELRERFEIAKDVNGVLVTAVAGGSNAAEKGVNPGDVILQVEQDKVTTPAQVQAKLAEVRKEGRKNVLILVDRSGRGGQQAFIVLRVDKS